jgi:hypothetical protein
VQDVGVLKPAAVPTLQFALAIESLGDTPVRSISLNVELRIAATRRPYDERAQERLVELFGAPDQWARTLRSLHWTSLTLNVAPFTGSTVVDLPVTCTYDLEVTAAQYFGGLEDGAVPLEFLFSGTVFYTDQGRLQIAHIGWDKEADFRMPVSVWKEMIEYHFPGSSWLRLRRESFEALHAYKARHTLLTWDDTIAALLRAADEKGDG